MVKFKDSRIFLVLSKEVLSPDMGMRHIEDGHAILCNDSYIVIKQKDLSAIICHLYITEEDKIKKIEEQSWYMNIHKSSVFSKGEDIVNKKNWRKIISTTDDSLKISVLNSLRGWIKVNLPRPSLQLIKKYIQANNRGKIITNVLVAYDVEIEQFVDDIFPDKLKIDPIDNTIDIKLFEVAKDKEEILELFLQCNHDLRMMRAGDIRDWINKNI